MLEKLLLGTIIVTVNYEKVYAAIHLNVNYLNITCII